MEFIVCKDTGKKLTAQVGIIKEKIKEKVYVEKEVGETEQAAGSLY
jgi:hypothetical protein